MNDVNALNEYAMKLKGVLEITPSGCIGWLGKVQLESGEIIHIDELKNILKAVKENND
jgi:hypothetical protein